MACAEELSTKSHDILYRGDERSRDKELGQERHASSEIFPRVSLSWISAIVPLDGRSRSPGSVGL
jgi:hypothetical protein